MNRPACAVTVALASPLASIAAGVATNGTFAMAATFAACLVAAPIISRPETRNDGRGAP